MTIEQAIQKAIEGGWSGLEWHDEIRVETEDTRGGVWGYDEDGSGAYLELPVILLDPTFWQALGKSMGWGTEMWHEDDGKTYWDYYWHCSVCAEIINDPEEGCPDGCETDNAYVISWHYHWLALIDHLAEGKSVEEFFEKL